jgi:hypothetical protein
MGEAAATGMSRAQSNTSILLVFVYYFSQRVFLTLKAACDLN